MERGDIMADSVGRIDLDLGLNYSQFNNQLGGIAGKAQGLVGGAFKKLGVTIAAAFAVKTITDFSRGAIQLASDLSEVQNVVDVTFGGMSAQINEFASNALQKFGMSELSAKKFSSTVGAMMKSSGITGQKLVDLSTGVTGLAADMASFYNLDHQEAFDKIRAGLSGETEPLKQLGVNMSVANMEAFALSKGITKAYQSMSQSEQVLLRYNYLLSATKDAQGDFARTSGGWANQTRLLTEQWKIFKTTMGQGFINILTPIISVINTLISKLQIAAQYFRAFTELLTGKAQQATAGAVSGVTDMADAAGALGENITKAGKAVKGSLAGFDQLNTLGDKSDTGGGGGGGGGGSTPELPDIPKIGESVAETIDKIKASLVGLFKPFKDSWDLYGPTVKANFDTIMAGIKEIAMTAGETLRNIWSNPSTQQALQTLVGIFMDIFKILTRIFDEVIKPAVLDFLNMLDPTQNPAAQGFLDMMASVLDGVKLLTGYLAGDGFKYVEDFLKLFAGFKAAQFVVQMGLATVAIWGDVAAWVGNTVAMGINLASRAGKFLTTIGSFIVAMWKSVAALIAEAVTMDGATVAQWALNLAMSLNPIGLVVAGVVALIAILVVCYNKFDWFREGVNNIVNKIIGAFNKLIGGLNKLDFAFPDWVPGLGGKNFGVNIPQIPYLANGGLVHQPTLAMVGDNKNAATDPEVISPLSKLKDMLGGGMDDSRIVELLTKILAVLQSQQGDIILKLSETEFGRAAIKAINSTTRISGQTQLIV